VCHQFAWFLTLDCVMFSYCRVRSSVLPICAASTYPICVVILKAYTYLNVSPLCTHWDVPPEPHTHAHTHTHTHTHTGLLFSLDLSLKRVVSK